MKHNVGLKTLFLSSLLLISLFAILVINIKTAEAIGPILIGGKITAVTICDTGFLIAVSPPRPGTFMLLPTSRRYTPESLSFPFIGQWILGLAGQVPVTCMLGPIPYGSGLPILMAGASAK
jgi:hypothetical protein